jgi:Holliday junction resolvase RusA-like endonuclease
MASIEFFAFGTPVPKGSAKAFYNPRARKVIVMQDNADKQKPWASNVGYAASQCMIGKPLMSGAIALYLRFYMPAPKKNKRRFPTCRPDLDKLIRCVKDALTKVAWTDDSIVVKLDAAKEYGDRIGCDVRVSEIELGESK